MNEHVYQNPMWENARKALEAVSPKKPANMLAEQQENNSNGQQQNMSPQEMYYQQLNNFKQNQGMGQRPP